MTKRTGVPALMEVARRMCLLIVKFSPVIQRLYPENDAVLTALAAANAACEALTAELVLIREYGT